MVRGPRRLQGHDEEGVAPVPGRRVVLLVRRCQVERLGYLLEASGGPRVGTPRVVVAVVPVRLPEVAVAGRGAVLSCEGHVADIEVHSLDQKCVADDGAGMSVRFFLVGPLVAVAEEEMVPRRQPEVLRVQRWLRRAAFP